MKTTETTDCGNREPLLGNHVRTNGKLTSRFEMLVRWPDGAGRKMNPFLYRGDRFGVLDPGKMLCNHVKHFVKEYKNWIYAEVVDQTLPLNHPDRVILKWNKGVIEENRLNKYAHMLQLIHVPEWLIN